MPRTSGEISIYFETHGDSSCPPLLMVNGFGQQLTGWHPEMLASLVERGLFIIVYDNRDVGLSTHLDGVPSRINEILAARKAKSALDGIAPYSLSDMAADGISVLDELGIGAAHIFGNSMGGMLVQRMAIDFPNRVLSMCSVMSHTGEQGVGRSTDEANAGLLATPPSERDAYIEHTVRTAKIWASRYHWDPDAEAARAQRAFDRCYYPEGTGRQFAAIMSAPSRADALQKLTIPVSVIHGRHDTLITPSGGERTAELIPNSRLLMLDGMGHDFPKPLWPAIIDSVVSNIERVTAISKES